MGNGPHTNTQMYTTVAGGGGGSEEKREKKAENYEWRHEYMFPSGRSSKS